MVKQTMSQSMSGLRIQAKWFLSWKRLIIKISIICNDLDCNYQHHMRVKTMEIVKGRWTYWMYMMCHSRLSCVFTVCYNIFSLSMNTHLRAYPAHIPHLCVCAVVCLRFAYFILCIIQTRCYLITFRMCNHNKWNTEKCINTHSHTNTRTHTREHQKTIIKKII